MPIEHIFYIPAVFLLGMLAGRVLSLPRRDIAPTAPRSTILGWSVVAALALSVSIFVLTHIVAPLGGVHSVTTAAHGQAVLDQHPVFSASEIYARLGAFGAAGRQAYQAMTYSSDVLFPASLLLTLLLLGAYLGRRTSVPASGHRWTTLLPIGWFVADMAENAMIYLILDVYPEHVVWAAALGAVTAVKFALLLSSILALAAVGWAGRARKSVA